ncbi:MAG TPA: hypothetical protein V6D29_11955 [Leptolyngbyaceae cyanobacterium]
MPLLAVIDIGTHSALLLIADVNSQVMPVLDEARTTHLGVGLKETGQISSEAQARLITVLASYAAILSEYEIDDVICYATAAFRYAQNATACQHQIKAALGWSVRVLSGQEEAAYTFQGALQGISAGQGSLQQAVVIDIGGGSTEVICGTHSAVDRWWSLPVGAVLLKEQFSLEDCLSVSEEQAVDTYLDAQFQEIELFAVPQKILVTGGTATTLAALMLDLTSYDIRKIDGCAIAHSQIESLYEELNRLTLAQRADLPGMEAGRAAVILPAIRILLRLLARLQASGITVTVRGARYGILEG